MVKKSFTFWVTLEHLVGLNFKTFFNHGEELTYFLEWIQFETFGRTGISRFFSTIWDCSFWQRKLRASITLIRVDRHHYTNVNDSKSFFEVKGWLFWTLYYCTTILFSLVLIYATLDNSCHHDLRICNFNILLNLEVVDVGKIWGSSKDNFHPKEASQIGTKIKGVSGVDDSAILPPFY